MSLPRGPLLRDLLAELGGTAGCKVLAEGMSARLGEELSTRRVRHIAKSAPGRVLDLGAGYLTLLPTRRRPVVAFAVDLILDHGNRLGVDALVDAVLAEYPHGDRRAVRAWLAQEPGRIQVDRDRVRYLGPRRA